MPRLPDRTQDAAFVAEDGVHRADADACSGADSLDGRGDVALVQEQVAGCIHDELSCCQRLTLAVGEGLIDIFHRVSIPYFY